MPTFQIASDLHLEFYDDPKDIPKLAVSADYLILAGDIGHPYNSHYVNYLTDLSGKYKTVFVVTGNHEYYCKYSGENSLHTIESINEKIVEICNSLPNVIFLNNKSFDIDDEIIIIGSTLWTNIPDKMKYYIKSRMNDYNYIWKKDNNGNFMNIGPDDVCAMHQVNVSWLTSELDKYKGTNKKIIVVSHHLPSDVFVHDMYKGDRILSGFMTNLDHLIGPNIKCWIAGHTHKCINETLNGVQCIVNPCGYPGENPEFKNDLIINL
jgi:predicted phosphodiesterase